MTRTLPAENDSVRLGELVDQVTEGDLVQLTRGGRVAAVVLSHDAYDRLLLAVSADARRDLGDIIEKSRREVAATGVDRAVVDEAIAAVRGS